MHSVCYTDQKVVADSLSWESQGVVSCCNQVLRIQPGCSEEQEVLFHGAISPGCKLWFKMEGSLVYIASTWPCNLASAQSAGPQIHLAKSLHSIFNLLPQLSGLSILLSCLNLPAHCCQQCSAWIRYQPQDGVPIKTLSTSSGGTQLRRQTATDQGCAKTKPAGTVVLCCISSAHAVGLTLPCQS